MDQVLQLYGLKTSITAAKTLTLAATDDYTLTVPATGTVALLAVANALTGANTFTNAAGIIARPAATSRNTR